MDNRETLEKLKMLNSLLEDFLDRMDMDAADEEDDEYEDKKECKRRQADANRLMEG